MDANTVKTTTDPSASLEREYDPMDHWTDPDALEKLSENDDAEVILAPE